MSETSRLEQMRKACAMFHYEHPEVWNMFERFTFEMINRGFKNYSAQHGIFARIRWETDVPDVDGNSTFKVNNNFSAFYARRFMRMYPQYEGFFRTRVQTSAGDPASPYAELGPADFPYTNQ